MLPSPMSRTVRENSMEKQELYDDSLVRVYDPANCVVYEGIWDYCQYHNEDWIYNWSTEQYELRGDYGLYLLEIID